MALSSSLGSPRRKIKKRREDQAAARIEKDGYDRMKPLAEDNHPPNTIWPPVGGGS